MTMDDLARYFSELAARLNDALNKDIPDIVGIEAVNHYQEGFQNEGFTDKALDRWVEVKRRQGKGKGADAGRKILTGRTGALHDSIEYKVEPGKVIVSANPANAGAGVNYAAVHNFGVNNAGRRRNTTIPKRQFIGESQALNKKIQNAIEEHLKKVIGNQ
jgi:phage gpG-like protein